MEFLNSRRLPLDEDTFVDIETARFYDEHARRFMGSVYRRLAARAARIGPVGTRVLDIGTGSGRLAIELVKTCPDWQVIGTDNSGGMLAIARQNAAQSGLMAKIDFRQAPAAALPFPDHSFSLITSNASLHLWQDPLAAFKEIARVTTPGGYCLIWDNLRWPVLRPLLSLIGLAMGMNMAQRKLWLDAVRASYTTSEIKEILWKSPLKNARVSIIPPFFYLGIQWRKPETAA